MMLKIFGRLLSRISLMVKSLVQIEPCELGKGIKAGVVLVGKSLVFGMVKLGRRLVEY